MAIKNLFGRGVGFNEDVIGWVVTHGYGDLSAGGGAAGGGFVDSQQTQWVAPINTSTTWVAPFIVTPIKVTRP